MILPIRLIDSVEWLFWCSLFLSGHYSSNAPLSPHFIYSFMFFSFFWISSNINDFIIYAHFFMYSYHMGTGDYCRPQIFTKITIKQQQLKTLKAKKQKHTKKTKQNTQTKQHTNSETHTHMHTRTCMHAHACTHSHTHSISQSPKVSHPGNGQS